MEGASESDSLCYSSSQIKSSPRLSFQMVPVLEPFSGLDPVVKVS